jgi:hypothetical protein
MTSVKGDEFPELPSGADAAQVSFKSSGVEHRLDDHASKCPVDWDFDKVLVRVILAHSLGMTQLESERAMSYASWPIQFFQMCLL